MASVVFAKVAWEKEFTETILPDTNGPFDDIDNINSFPKCLESLNTVFKICGFLSHSSDISLAWVIWAVIFRIGVIVFSIIIFIPNSGTNTLLGYVTDSDVMMLRISVFCVTIMFTVSSLYPLVFCRDYIQKGNIHQLLKNLIKTKYIHHKYLSVTLCHDLQKLCRKCQYFIMFSFMFQWIGWMVVNIVQDEQTRFRLQYVLLPLCWALFKWLPFCTAIALLLVVLYLLREAKSLYIAQIAACDCRFRAKQKSSFYYICHNIDISNVKPIEDSKEIENQLIDSYLNLAGLCTLHSNKWQWFLIIVGVCMFFAALSSFLIFIHYDTSQTQMADMIMLPAYYIILSFVLLYEIADLNATTDKALQLLSASRFGDDDIDVNMYVIKILTMMQFNRVNMTVSGFVVDNGKLNAAAVTLLGFMTTAMSNYLFSDDS